MKKNIGEIRKSERCLSLVLLLFVWFQLFLLFFSGGYPKNVTAKQGLRSCFYQKAQDTNQCFQVSVTAGVLL